MLKFRNPTSRNFDKSQENPLKLARAPDMYQDKSHIDYYSFI